MEGTEVLDEPGIPPAEPFDPEEYQNATFSMFSGKTQMVRLKLANHLVNAVIDRFGRNVSIHPFGDSHFAIRVPVKAEQPLPFFGWLFQFGADAEILEPVELREAYRQALSDVLNAHT